MTVLQPGPPPSALREDPWTWANRVSLVRTVLALGLSALASTRSSLPLLAAAYAVYWVGDVLDGQIARRTGTETRQGAVLDILCDRASCGMLAVTLIGLEPRATWPVTVFLLQFMVVDCLLSLGFLRWPVLSPNYFYLIDRLAYTLNWHVVAKVTNTTLLVLLLVFVPDQRVALVAASAVLVVKLYSLVRVLRLRVPADTLHVPQGAAARA